MKKEDTFSKSHPIINFTYFVLVLFFSMFLMHPLHLLISFCCAAVYHIYLSSWKSFKKQLVFIIPMFFMTTIINTLFQHRGNTILTYLPSGNPVTLESAVYGAVAAIMLASVIIWFSNYNIIMTSDKFLYLFGKIMPSLSLILSMILRFIPKLKVQFQLVCQAQKYMGRELSQYSLFQKMKNAVIILSIMITWSMENAIDTADSMKSRGYGLPGRTVFSIYRFDKRDKIMILWLCFCAAFVFWGWIRGTLKFHYYPNIKKESELFATLCFELIYLLLCLTPMLLNWKEYRKWKHSQYAI